jgi:hypothetical protein
MADPSSSRQTRVTSWVLFFTFWGIYVASAIGILGMLFFGFGTVRDSERFPLISVFIIESGSAVVAVFYSVHGLRKTSAVAEGVDVSELRDQLRQKDERIQKLEDEARLIKANHSQAPPESTYHDAIIGICSHDGGVESNDILRALGLDPEKDREEANKVLNDIGRMKRAGELENFLGTARLQWRKV